MRLRNRHYFSLGLLVCVAALATVYFFQYVKGLHPCPLCIMQRLAFYGYGLVCLLAVIQHAKGKMARMYSMGLTLLSSFGISMALRQLYLQHLPAGQAPACAPSLNFMLKNFPLHEVLKTLFYGSGDCAIVHWKFLGLSMAGWSLMCMLVLFVLSVKLWWQSR